MGEDISEIQFFDDGTPKGEYKATNREANWQTKNSARF
jgi:hypothetical protein